MPSALRQASVKLSVAFWAAGADVLPPSPKRILPISRVWSMVRSAAAAPGGIVWVPLSAAGRLSWVFAMSNPAMSAAGCSFWESW